jgi:two-component system, response regulator / RNA-binding antiterminator
MARALRVAIADDEVSVQDFYAETLRGLGHEVVCQATTGAELVEGCRRAMPDLVISNARMRDMPATEAAGRLARTRPTPWIVVAGGDDATLQSNEHIAGCVNRPLQPRQLDETIPRSLERFAAARRQADGEAERLRQALQEHRLVERAKSILMRSRGWDEDESLRWLQEQAADRGLSLAEAARGITLDARQASELKGSTATDNIAGEPS